jgi:hypothetical protein
MAILLMIIGKYYIVVILGYSMTIDGYFIINYFLIF